MSIVNELLNKIKAYQGDELELIAIHKLFWENGMIFKGEEVYEIVNQLKNISNQTTKSKSLLLIADGLLYTFHPKYGNAMLKLNEAITTFKQLNDNALEGAAQSLLSMSLKNNGQLDKALECVHQSIQNLGQNEILMQYRFVAHYQGGEINHLLKDYKSAIQYFSDGLKIPDESSFMIPRLLVGLANVYKDTDELDKAFEYFQKALHAIEGKGINILESKIYADIANYHFRKNNLEEAILFHQKSTGIREKFGMKNPLITNYIELAEINLQQNKLNEAKQFAMQAEVLSKELNIILKLAQVYFILSRIYEATGDTPVALDYYKKYHQTKEEVFSQESARQIKQLSIRHEMENVEKENELFRLKNVVLKEALDEISASVRYAKRIQDAILPPQEFVNKHLANNFILYKPKDIVAGDFYWAEFIHDKFYIAAADSTGHGVPGAMVSVVCSNALNRSVKEFKLTETGKILDKTRELVLQTFEKSANEVKDGMDISLLCIDAINKKISWSGANNPLWYIDPLQNQLIEIKADKQPIGKTESPSPFNTHQINYTVNSTFYLFTDGFADQFGGPQGKKFKYKPLADLLYTNSNLNMISQSELIEETFMSWKGQLEQIDDVCIIGVKI